MINRDISSLYPPVAKIVTAFLGRWNHEQPDKAGVFEAYRSFSRQGELYAQGRTTPGKKVTNAIPGLSWHNYGLAVDVVFDSDPIKPDIQATWQDSKPWKLLGRMGESFGLEWAGSWRTFVEFPHFELTFGLRIQEAYELHQLGGIEAVWKSLDLTRQVIGRRA